PWGLRCGYGAAADAAESGQRHATVYPACGAGGGELHPDRHRGTGWADGWRSLRQLQPGSDQSAHASGQSLLAALNGAQEGVVSVAAPAAGAGAAGSMRLSSIATTLHRLTPCRVSS